MLTLEQLYNLGVNVDIDIFSGLNVPENSPINRTVLINTIMEKCGLNIPMYADPFVMSSAITVWSARNQYTFEHVAKIINAEYSPIDNKNYEESTTVERTRTMDDDTEGNSTKSESANGRTDMDTTVNRNRELEGRDPFKVVLLSNAQRLGNPILRGFNLIPIIENMQKQGQRSYANGPIRIELPFSEVSEAKRNTALYKATSGTSFSSEALDNNFVNDSFTGVQKVNLTEFTPMFCIDNIYLYKHKSEVLYYACSTPASNVKKYRSIDNFVIFYKLYGLQLKLAYGSDKLLFSDYSTKIDLLNLLKMLY